MRIKIPVAELEFDNSGNTIWVHSPPHRGGGATVLRIKTMGKIVVKRCATNPVSHADILVKGTITICVHPDDLPKPQ